MGIINKEEGILFKEEVQLKWRDLYKIRQHLAISLRQYNFTRLQADPIVIIISELLENAFKYIDKKHVTVIIKYTSETTDQLTIKIHHPVATLKSHNLKILLAIISRVNQCDDIDKFFIDSLREATLTNSKANKFRFSLIRKTARGAHIHIKKSHIYNPGVAISIPFNLHQ